MSISPNIISTNAERRRIDCRFAIGGVSRDAAINVLFEDRRIGADGGSFTDTFRPYERHVYELGIE